MKRLNFLPSADADLKGIHFRIARDDEGAADRLIRKLVSATRRLEQYPESTTARPDISEDYRSLVVGLYLALYRVSADSVDVVRVVHGARDLGRLGESR